MKRTVLVILTLVMTTVISVSAFADHGHQRGKDKGHGKGHMSQPNKWKKAQKFVNGHDARDGRWDKRGPKHHR